jgi:hypothetical protein
MATKDIGLKARLIPDLVINTNYAMLALIIEKVTNMSYKKAMERMIFKPGNETHLCI